jgi:hypothetical protein
VVFVEDYAVEVQLLAVGHLVDVFLVVAGADRRIEVAARHRGPGRTGVELWIGEQVEVVEFHS